LNFETRKTLAFVNGIIEWRSRQKLDLEDVFLGERVRGGRAKIEDNFEMQEFTQMLCTSSLLRNNETITNINFQHDTQKMSDDDVE